MSIAEYFVKKLLSQIQLGRLELQDGQQVLTAGSAEGAINLTAKLQVHSQKLYARVLHRGSIGAGESFMLGEWTTNDLVALLRIFIRNRELLFGIDGGIAKLNQIFWRFLDHFKRNTAEQSTLNISAHYDLGNDFFKLFLDHSLMYSSAIFENPNMDLEAAAQHKLAVICEGLKLQSHHRVIEIGTGWGGFAIYAAQHYGCHVTTTTISAEQYQYAKVQIEALGLQDKITLLQQDYRALSGQYDRLVSIEMIEAVGYDFVDQFVRQCSNLLTPNGKACIQAIIRADQHYDRVHKEVDFIKKYIFPGGCLLSVEYLLRQAAAHTDLRLFHLRDIGYDYAKTLAIWRQRFLQKLDSVRALGFNEPFMRMWEFYLAYCEAGFLERYISVVQLNFVKPYYDLR